MANKFDDQRIAALKEVNRLLKLALDETEALLTRAQRWADHGEQDNDPPK